MIGFDFVSVVNDLYIFYLCLYWVCLDYYLIFRLCQGYYLIVWLCQECHEPIICNARSSPKSFAYSSSSDSLLQFVMIIVITNYLILRSCHGCHKVIPLSHRHRRNSYLCIILRWRNIENIFEKITFYFYFPLGKGLILDSTPLHLYVFPPWCLFPKTPQLNKQREVEIKTSSVFSTASRVVSEKGGTEAQFTIHNTRFELM